MTIKLEEFRLETYAERSALQSALTLWKSKYPELETEAVDTLLTRISQTQCMEGGCSLCGGPSDDWEDDYDSVG